MSSCHLVLILGCRGPYSMLKLQNAFSACSSMLQVAQPCATYGQASSAQHSVQSFWQLDSPTDGRSKEHCQCAKCCCRWKVTPLRQGEWRQWFDQQMKLAKKQAEQGLYVSLRLDGRVRASGVGQPPWQILSAQLAPVTGVTHYST